MIPLSVRGCMRVRTTSVSRYSVLVLGGEVTAADADELRRELGTLSHGRVAVRGYGAGSGVPALAVGGGTRVDIAG